MKKRLGTFISALLFCLLCLPGVGLAAEFTVDNLKYNTTGVMIQWKLWEW